MIELYRTDPDAFALVLIGSALFLAGLLLWKYPAAMLRRHLRQHPYLAEDPSATAFASRLGILIAALSALFLFKVLS